MPPPYKRGPRLPAAKPGPAKGVLPPPLPPGQIPGDDSRLWMFIPKAISAGERWIQDDTRDWFDLTGGLAAAQIRRDYPTHPRWLVGAAGDTARGAILNEGIVSEVHLLVRITAGLPDMPPWVAARLSLKQAQADLAYRLTKAANGTFREKGKEAIKDFAERSPGQFIKWISSTFIPKQIEQTVELRPGGGMDPETADAMIEMMQTELQRRAEEARRLVNNPTDFEVGPVAETLQEAANEFATATGVAPGRFQLAGIVEAKRLDSGAARGLKKVVDLEADEYEVLPRAPAPEIEWD